MMTMVMTPYRRRYIHRPVSGDSLAQIEHIHSDVHVPLDVVDEKDAFVIYATVPGLNAEDLEIEVVDNTVDIRGEFKIQADEEIKFLRQERPTGTFRRYLRFSTKLDTTKSEAKLNNGILTLRVNKAEESLPKSIKINTK